MSLKFYYDLISPPSRALYIILKMSGTSYEACQVALRKGVHKTVEFKRNINRFQRVPCINDNGFKLAESVAILRYLATKSQILPTLYPSDQLNQIRIDEFLEWQHIDLRYACSKYFHGLWLDPLVEHKLPESKKIENLINDLECSLNVMENVWLHRNAYLTGNILTAADIFGACEIEQIKLFEYDRHMKYPKIRTWLQRIRHECSPHHVIAHKYVYGILERNGLSSKI